jgi:hypothetical protein
MTSQKTPPASAGATQAGLPAQAGGQRSGKSVYEGFDAVHNRYFQALQEAWQAMHMRLLEHQRGLQSTYEGIVRETASKGAQEMHSSFLKAQQDYLAGLQGLGAETLKSIAGAYREYLRSMQRELGQIDPENMEPRLLAAVGQSMIMVATAAHQARGLTGQ